MVATWEMWARYRRGMGEIRARYRRGMGEVWARCGRGMGEMWARYGEGAAGGGHRAEGGRADEPVEHCEGAAPAQCEKSGRHGLSRFRLRATPSRWDIKQGRASTPAGIGSTKKSRRVRLVRVRLRG